MHITNISTAKTNLSLLIKAVQETNKPIIIGKAGKPIAILSAYKEEQSPRELKGNWKGKVEVHDDFDKTDDEIADSFYDSILLPATTD